MWVHIPRLYSDQIIDVPVRTGSRQRICCNLFHESKPNTTYFRTSPTIDGINRFTIKVPKYPTGAILEVYNEANGNREFDSTFQVGKISVNKMVPNLVATGIMNKTARAFVQFSDAFAEDAGVISAQNRVYESPDKQFRIDYKYVIRDKQGLNINEVCEPT